MTTTYVTTVTCSACGRHWTEAHACSVPPPIEFRRYTTGALKRLAADLTLVLEDRAKAEP